MNPDKITYFAETDARNKRVAFGIRSVDRTRHMYVIGKTGMGKSTLLENMAIQDIQNGEGIAFIDPHGGTAEKLLEYVPKERIGDVLYFAPFDTDYPISFNVMEDIGADKRHLVVNGLMSTFEKIWVDAWSARMAYILSNTLLALLEFPGSTLLGVNRMLADKEYRKKVVENVKDPSVKSFWIEEFGKYTERFAAEATPAIQNKIGQFTSNPLVRNIIGQSRSTFDIRKMMDEKKILIINLSKGRVGEGNANLLGSMLITKIYLAAMSRADSSESQLKTLPNFYLYVDEFQSFANKSFADILSEARKYKLNLTIAHQYIEQMEEEVRDAVFGNVGTMITFRVGAFDAEVLEKEFAPVFTAEDLVNLGSRQIYLKLMIGGVSSQPFSAVTQPPIARPDISYRDDILEHSRKVFARPKEQVEKEIKDWHEEGIVKQAPPAPRPQQASPARDDKSKKEDFNSQKREVHTAETRSTTHSPQKSTSNSNTEHVRRSDKKDILKEKREIFESIIAEEKKHEETRSKPAPIHLKDLEANNKQRNERSAGQAHVSELKKALENLVPRPSPQKNQAQSNMGVNKPPLPSKEDASTREREIKNSDGPKAEEGKLKKKIPHEIPEDELLKLLKVDMDE
jgi:hypothetical protein